MQIPGTYPVRFKVRPGIDRVAAIKAIREALDPTRIGLKEAKEGFDAGVIYAAPDMVPALLAALAPYADTETTYGAAKTRFLGVCERLAARVLCRVAEILEQVERQLD